MEIDFETITEFCKRHWSRLIIIGLFLLILIKLGKVEEINGRFQGIESRIEEIKSGIDELQKKIEAIYLDIPSR